MNIPSLRYAERARACPELVEGVRFRATLPPPASANRRLVNYAQGYLGFSLFVIAGIIAYLRRTTRVSNHTLTGLAFCCKSERISLLLSALVRQNKTC